MSVRGKLYNTYILNSVKQSILTSSKIEQVETQARRREDRHIGSYLLS